VKRHVPPPAGAISVVPAGTPARWRWSGRKDSLHIYLELDLVGRVAAEAFGLDPARLTVPPLDGLDLPHLRAAMGAVGAELTAGGAGEAGRRVAGQRPGRPPDPTGGTARCRVGASAPSSSTSRNTSAPATKGEGTQAVKP
jgi:hypothetical protein